ncbi:hypothetical protein MMC17_000794 [Xylographa soralifera]|nr:hypothetical protein [Xylographa soralifera]
MTKHAEVGTQLKRFSGMVRQYSEQENSGSSSESDAEKAPSRSRTSSAHLPKPRRNGRRGRGRAIRTASFSRDSKAIATSTELQLTQHTTQHQPSNLGGLPCQPEASAMPPCHSVETDRSADQIRLASIEPPITKASLSELDLKRIINDSKLRHDLNFEVEIIFRPNYYGLKGEHKKAMASAYWTALAAELTIYVGQRQHHISSAADLSNLRTESCPSVNTQTTTRRLPKMFYVLREILKSLVPEAEWFSIEQALDVDFIMQQLDKGVCDLNGLIGWLGTLLMGSCSPCRDPTVLRMVETVQRAVVDQDVQGIVSGIDQLFSILEIMKLDVANHQIRELKLLMIDDTVQFQQRYFLGRIQSGMQVEEARHWYSSAVQHEPQQPESLDACRSVFARAVIDLVIGNEPCFPTTFVFDTDRLRALQAEFQNHIYQELCGKAFDHILELLGYIASPPLSIYQDLLHRVLRIEESLCATGDSLMKSEDTVLEIVRTAYTACGISSLPSDKHVAATKSYLMHAMDVNSTMYQQLECNLCSELEDIVDDELETISTLTPLQILNHYHPTAASPRSSSQRSGLHDMGQRLAHIIVLHWWTWSPILYLQPRESKPVTCQSCIPSDQSTDHSGRPQSVSLPELGAVWGDNPQTDSTSTHNKASREAG